MLINLQTIPPFYKKYVKLVEEPDLLQALRVSNYRMLDVLASIGEGHQDFRYAEDKWSIRELLCHIIDAERIFAYRALRFARNDKTALHGWEENDYAPEANAGGRSLRQIADEMSCLRASTLHLFEGFTAEMLGRKGIANDNEMSVLRLVLLLPATKRTTVRFWWRDTSVFNED